MSPRRPSKKTFSASAEQTGLKKKRHWATKSDGAEGDDNGEWLEGAPEKESGGCRMRGEILGEVENVLGLAQSDWAPK